MVVPERSPGGHRLYSSDQVERLRFVAAEVTRGLSAADAHRLLAEHGEAAEPLRDDDAAPANGRSCWSPNVIPWPRTSSSSSCAPRGTRWSWYWPSAKPSSSGSNADPSSRSWS